MSRPFLLRRLPPDRFGLTVSKSVGVSARRQLEWRIHYPQVIHLHFAFLVFGLKPFRQNEVAYLDPIYFVEARFHRIANLVRYESLAPPPRFVPVKPMRVKIDARIGKHLKHLVRDG